MSEPLATHDYDRRRPGRVALEFLKRTRWELRILRKARVWKDRLQVIDVNGDCFEVRGVGYPDADVVPLLRAVNAAFDPETIHDPTDRRVQGVRHRPPAPLGRRPGDVMPAGDPPRTARRLPGGAEGPRVRLPDAGRGGPGGRTEGKRRPVAVPGRRGRRGGGRPRRVQSGHGGRGGGKRNGTGPGRGPPGPPTTGRRHPADPGGTGRVPVGGPCVCRRPRVAGVLQPVRVPTSLGIPS